MLRTWQGLFGGQRNTILGGIIDMRRAIATLAVILALGPAWVLLAEPLEKLPESPRLRVLAWNGPPAEHSTAPRMQELAEAGFTDCSFAVSFARAGVAFDAAQTAGIKLWVVSPELRRDPEATVRQLQNHPALGGYFLTDEPSVKQFAELAAWAARIRAVDAAHPCYINLFPNYATPQQLGVDTYDEYIDRYVGEVPGGPISFDFYPDFHRGSAAAAYVNLATIADAAQQSRRPFWAFTLSVAHGDHPVATAEQMRLQVYSDLAYGAQAIQYFTYWTPPHAAGRRFSRRAHQRGRLSTVAFTTESAKSTPRSKHYRLSLSAQKSRGWLTPEQESRPAPSALNRSRPSSNPVDSGAIVSELEQWRPPLPGGRES